MESFLLSSAQAPPPTISSRPRTAAKRCIVSVPFLFGWILCEPSRDRFAVPRRNCCFFVLEAPWQGITRETREQTRKGGTTNDQRRPFDSCGDVGRSSFLPSA